MTPVKDGFPSIWSVIGKERDVPSCRGDQDEVLDLFCFRHWSVEQVVKSPHELTAKA